MRDQNDDLVFQAFRHQLGSDVARLARSIAYAFERLQARLYDAPWSRIPGAKKACSKDRYTVV
jgi:hypothetical protein